MSLKKQYLKTKQACKVTFIIKNEFASRVNLVGDFNKWDTDSIPMKKTKKGDFCISIELEKGRGYQFKYLVDGKEWLNELDSDKFVINEFQSENSVVVV